MEQLSSTRLGNLDCPRGLHSEAMAIQDRVAKKQQLLEMLLQQLQRFRGKESSDIFTEKKNTPPLVSHCYFS